MAVPKHAACPSVDDWVDESTPPEPPGVGAEGKDACP
jgi:hypothetical protein